MKTDNKSLLHVTSQYTLLVEADSAIICYQNSLF
jgi:hypothetical protein